MWNEDKLIKMRENGAVLLGAKVQNRQNYNLLDIHYKENDHAHVMFMEW